jgi:hypothetical protein
MSGIQPYAYGPANFVVSLLATNKSNKQQYLLRYVVNVVTPLD